MSNPTVKPVLTLQDRLAQKKTDLNNTLDYINKLKAEQNKFSSIALTIQGAIQVLEDMIKDEEPKESCNVGDTPETRPQSVA